MFYSGNLLLPHAALFLLAAEHDLGQDLYPAGYSKLRRGPLLLHRATLLSCCHWVSTAHLPHLLHLCHFQELQPAEEWQRRRIDCWWHHQKPKYVCFYLEIKIEIIRQNNEGNHEDNHEGNHEDNREEESSAANLRKVKPTLANVHKPNHHQQSREGIPSQTIYYNNPLQIVGSSQTGGSHYFWFLFLKINMINRKLKNITTRVRLSVDKVISRNFFGAKELNMKPGWGTVVLVIRGGDIFQPSSNI